MAALKDVDFQAGPGSITTLLGPNGAGKSTLLGCIAGMLLPTEGEVCVGGEREPGRIRAAVGYAGEAFRPDGRLTVAESLAFAASGGMDLARRAVGMAGLGDVLGKRCGTLSKGYIQRLALALAVCRDPEVFILDEFSDGLDPAQRVAVRSALKELAVDRTVIVSTHSIGEALELGGTVFIMRSGTVVSSGSVEAILRETGKNSLEEAFLSLTEGGNLFF